MFEIVIHKKFSTKLKEMEKPVLYKIADLFENLRVNPIPWKKFDIKKIKGDVK